ncbi:hypothetical protein DPMN_006958 [Dreissena polymorpha]|uniref:Uncharacterized protein n=1 Tax=Dreissena polymorpha TaxID=45954 RepID=A0A9D4MTE5_DREPO|nr:hypothetical protein DPMN_006958 [Dreissena polymorpha]
MRRLTTWLVCTCVWITCLHVRLIIAFKEYHSCQNVKDDIGSSAVDGEYVVFLPWKKTVGIPVYCYTPEHSNKIVKENRLHLLSYAIDGGFM